MGNKSGKYFAIFSLQLEQDTVGWSRQKQLLFTLSKSSWLVPSFLYFQGSILYILHRKSYSPPPPFSELYFSLSGDKMQIQFQKFFLFNFPLNQPKFWLIFFPLRSFGTKYYEQVPFILPTFQLHFNYFTKIFLNFIFTLHVFHWHSHFIFPKTCQAFGKIQTPGKT